MLNYIHGLAFGKIYKNIFFDFLNISTCGHIYLNIYLNNSHILTKKKFRNDNRYIIRQDLLRIFYLV